MNPETATARITNERKTMTTRQIDEPIYARTRIAYATDSPVCPRWIRVFVEKVTAKKAYLSFSWGKQDLRIAAIDRHRFETEPMVFHRSLRRWFAREIPERCREDIH
jgi:hypothetical protein